MPLPSFLQRLRQQSAASGADANLPLSSAEIELARVRARRRLVGMVVLVGVGVVGLPWLFETQPRPLNPDVQVVSAVASRTPATSGPAQAIASVTVPESPAEPVDEEVETADGKPVAVVASAPAASASASKPLAARASAAATARAQPAAQAVALSKPPAKEPVRKDAPKAVVAADHAASTDSARAKALLEDKPPGVAKPASKSATTTAQASKPASKPDADAAGTRYVVQIGAFAEATAAHEVRLKAERAGVKTYTQEVTANGGKKIRVRVGPYANKAEADKAMDTLRKAGMTGALLTL